MKTTFETTDSSWIFEALEPDPRNMLPAMSVRGQILAACGGAALVDRLRASDWARLLLPTFGNDEYSRVHVPADPRRLH